MPRMAMTLTALIADDEPLLRASLRRQLAERLPIPIEYTDQRLCSDNAAAQNNLNASGKYITEFFAFMRIVRIG